MQSYTLRKEDGKRYLQRDRKNLDCPKYFKQRACGEWCPFFVIVDDESAVQVVCSPQAVSYKLPAPLIVTPVATPRKFDA